MFPLIKPLGRSPPAAFDENERTRVMAAVVARYMGANPRKGHTYTWIPNHLADAMGRVSPRSFPVAFAEAARWTRQRGGTERGAGLLAPTALGAAVKAATVQRDVELAEECEWLEQDA